jgi:hypothetical protein
MGNAIPFSKKTKYNVFRQKTISPPRLHPGEFVAVCFKTFLLSESAFFVFFSLLPCR